MQVASLGLGLMGTALAKRIIQAEHAVAGFDIDPTRGQTLESSGVQAAGSIAEAVADAEIIVLSLPNSQIGKEVCLGSAGIAETARRGAIVVDTTTARPSDTLDIATRLAGAGVRFVDSTVSGNPPMADRGDLVVMVGGASQDLADVRPVLEAFSRAIYHVGPVGTGARTKLIVNHVLGIHRVAIAEGLVVAEKADLDLDLILEVLRDSAAYSKAMDIWGERMVAGSHYPPYGRLNSTRKDLGLIVDQADEVAASAALARAALDVVDAGMADGLGGADNGVVMEALRRRAGLSRFDRSAILDGQEDAQQ